MARSPRRGGAQTSRRARCRGTCIGLEEALGRKLFERRRNALTLTESGEMLLACISKAFEKIEQTLAAVVAPDGAERTRGCGSTCRRASP